MGDFFDFQTVHTHSYGFGYDWMTNGARLPKKRLDGHWGVIILKVRSKILILIINPNMVMILKLHSVLLLLNKKKQLPVRDAGQGCRQGSSRLQSSLLF